MRLARPSTAARAISPSTSGGMIITARPLMELVPLERATMPGRVVVQWNKDDVEDAGLIKIDLLGLGMLALVAEAGNLIRAYGGETPAQEDLPLDDPAMYAMLRRADTIGCFQVESRAQQQMVHKHQPRVFNDIVVQVAIIRPGPIQGNMVHPYLRRRQGLEPVQLPASQSGADTARHPGHRALPGADHPDCHRRGRLHARRRRPAAPGDDRQPLERAMEAMRAEFRSRLPGTGLTDEQAAALFTQIRGFGQYGFCRSHAACFALLAYQSLWLKRYHPLPFYCALLNNQPMGFYASGGDRRRCAPPRRAHPAGGRAGIARCAARSRKVRCGWATPMCGRLAARASGRIARAMAEGPFTRWWISGRVPGWIMRAMTALAQRRRL